MRKVSPVVESSGLSYVGLVRQDNQDSIHLADGLCFDQAGGLFVVADGMGGYTHGAVASSLAVEKLVEAVLDGGRKPTSRKFKQGIEHANLSVYKMAQQIGAGRMGTTLTAAFISGEDLHLAHVGDCRAYLVRDGRAVCLTCDHTTVGDLFRSKLIPADKVRTHSQRSILTRAIGISLFVKPDISHLKLRKDDHLILCSDGVWSVVQDDEFAQVVESSRSIDQVSRSLLDLALERETDDNVSVVAVRIRDLLPANVENQEPVKTGWLTGRKKKVK